MAVSDVKSNRLVLIVGGARSGKSSFAERCGHSFSRVLYFATAHQRENDPEMAERIAKHRAARPSSWITLEPPTTLEEMIATVQRDKPEAVIVDCATLWLAWEMTKAHKQYSRLQLFAHLENEISHFVFSLASLACPVIVVSNETGMGVVPEHASGRAFRDFQGVLNKRLSENSALSLFMIAGQALLLRNANAPSDEGVFPIAVVTPAWVAKNLKLS
jgi:adenosylcobinamide kinase/adenosylcobinamide-phosphate guanylyltransferase